MKLTVAPLLAALVALSSPAWAAEAYTPSLLADKSVEELKRDLEAQLKSTSRFVRNRYKGWSMITYDLLTSISTEGESLVMEFDKTQVFSGQGPSTGIFTYSLRFTDLATMRFDAETCSGTHVRLPDRMMVRIGEPAAYRLCDTLYTLARRYDGARQEAEARFVQQAAAYRALTVKPPLAEDMRRLIVQAETLRQRKDTDGAIDLFRKAIGHDATAYPAAYFNLALLYELQAEYPRAIDSMRKYLALQPDAPDARAAQDKIYEWEILASEK